MQFIYNDGGRTAAGFKGTTGDCVTRAIAIVTGIPYIEVYDALNKLATKERTGKRKKKISNARSGVYRSTYHKYLISLGYTWTPTMLIGQGCKVHLRASELPSGRLIVTVSRHLTAVIDGVIHDLYNPQREGCYSQMINGVQTAVPTPGRCVYGYYNKTN